VFAVAGLDVQSSEVVAGGELFEHAVRYLLPYVTV
jgi:hypothetical protein